MRGTGWGTGWRTARPSAARSRTRAPDRILRGLLVRWEPRADEAAPVRDRRGEEAVLVEEPPHGINATHAEQFNRALLDFLAS